MHTYIITKRPYDAQKNDLVVVLRPSQHIKVMSRRSVYLTTLLDRRCPPRVKQYTCTHFVFSPEIKLTSILLTTGNQHKLRLHCASMQFNLSLQTSLTPRTVLKYILGKEFRPVLGGRARWSRYTLVADVRTIFVLLLLIWRFPLGIRDNFRCFSWTSNSFYTGW